MSEPASMHDFNTRMIAEFRANDGSVGGPFAGAMLLLHTTGARTGTPRINPLAYLRDGDRYIVFAAKAGAPTNPDWYHNLKAHPTTTIEVGPHTLIVIATEVTGPERDDLYVRQVRRYPDYDYQARTSRLIPVIALTPA